MSSLAAVIAAIEEKLEDAMEANAATKWRYDTIKRLCRIARAQENQIRGMQTGLSVGVRARLIKEADAVLEKELADNP